MNMQASQPAMMVTVAKAAQLLSAAGDKITAPNVSRYLARHPSINSVKQGRTRQVDIIALATHRQTNIFVADKQADRGLTPSEASAETLPPPLPTMAPAIVGTEPAFEDGTLGQINLELRRLELRRRTREEDAAAGRLVPDSEVLTLLSTVVRTVTASLERQEAGFAQKFGREGAAAFRHARKAAMAETAGRLTELAQKHLPPSLAPQAVDVGAPLLDEELQA
jgi:hypothetical protein